MSHYTDESLNGDSAALMKAAISEIGLDLANVARTLQVARTIANLDNSEQIDSQHISEALNYRTPYGT